MTKSSKIWIGVLVVGLALILWIVAFNKPASVVSDSPSDAPVGAVGTGVSGNTTQQVDAYTNGLVIGNQTVGFIQGVIGPGKNQAFYKNKTGRTLLIKSPTIGYATGTASSSLAFYVATSTGTTVTDYVRPTGTYLAIDAALLATSSGPIMFTSTSTSAGQSTLILRDGESIIFDVQERYGCKTVGVCETATSTNRGITNFNWNLEYKFLSQ